MDLTNLNALEEAEAEPEHWDEEDNGGYTGQAEEEYETDPTLFYLGEYDMYQRENETEEEREYWDGHKNPQHP